MTTYYRIQLGTILAALVGSAVIGAALLGIVEAIVGEPNRDPRIGVVRLGPGDSKVCAGTDLVTRLSGGDDDDIRDRLFTSPDHPACLPGETP